MARLPFSVLDLSPILSGKTARDALLVTVDLARHAEALGYRRFWVAEHHNAKGVACTAPEVVGQVAATTTTLRVGSGGIMLPNHVPLKVAETFRTLSAADSKLSATRQGWSERSPAATLAAVPVGVSPTDGDCPVDIVVIPGGGKGDRPVGSPEVEVSKGGEQLGRS